MQNLVFEARMSRKDAKGAKRKEAYFWTLRLLRELTLVAVEAR